MYYYIPTLRSALALFLAANLCAAWSASGAMQREADEGLSASELRYLSIEVELSLLNHPKTDQYMFKVEGDAANGTLTLTGEVADSETRAAAERIARRAIHGFPVELVNKTRVIPNDGEPPPPGEPTALDEEQMDRIRILLAKRFPDLAEDIYVTFELQPMPTIVLEGVIPSYEQKLEISHFVRGLSNKLPVLNNLCVRRQFDEDKIVYMVSPNEPRARIRERTRAPAVVTTDREPIVTDSDIAEQLGATLKADPVIKNCQIEVRVNDGVVWLSGRVESPGQRMRAIKLGSAQPGVRYVVNQLVIKPPGDQPGTVTVQTPQPDDVTFYVRRYLTTRIPELQDSTVEMIEGSIVIIPAEDVQLSQDEIIALEDRLARVPEFKEFPVVIKYKVGVKRDREK
jgi:osmotically-inducible protein OsmY